MLEMAQNMTVMSVRSTKGVMANLYAVLYLIRIANIH